MRTTTAHGRWLCTLLLIAGFVGTAHAQRTVTLQLNTATLSDTTGTADGDIQVRGCLEGCEGDSSDLPDGNIITWNDQTTLEPANAGGDFWEVSFEIPDNEMLAFKFYSQQAEDNQIGGWEDGANHEIAAGEGDTTLTLHFFEKGDDKAYDWRPYESKEDSIAVWFRVYMATEEGSNDGYDPDDDTQTVGVRGDNLDIDGDGTGDGPLDWGATLLTLEEESSEEGVPGYDLYSGVAYFDGSLAGQDQNYKFVIEGAETQFEEGNLEGNRLFTVPDADTTLRWVYYGNTAPVAGAEPVTSNVLFAVDLSPLETIGIFRRARGDTLEVRGGFNGWDCAGEGAPDDCLLQRVPGEDIFEAAVPVTRIPDTDLTYKYFLNFNNEEFMNEFGVEPPSGWEEGHNTGINRRSVFEGVETQDLGIAYFNDVTPQNVIPDGVSVDVNYTIDMSTALNNDADPFEPAGGDSVTVRLGDPIWAFTQDIVADDRDGGDFPLTIDEFILTDDDGDNVYTGTFTVNGPTYSILTFRYAYGQGTEFGEEQGTDTNEPGRNRTHFIEPNEDGSWPATYDVPADTFQVEAGPLPFEQNPAIDTGVEAIDDEVPSRIALGQNYPNPFNPTTAFTYTINKTQRVTVRVYDVLGRAVATLVDGVQPAATYEVTFDAGDLASGVYVYRLETAHQVLSKKMLLVK